MHLIDELHRLTDRLTPRGHLPSSIPSLLSLLQTGVMPDVEDGVKPTDLGEPGTDGFCELTTSFQTLSPMRLPFQQLARLQMVSPQLVDATLLLGLSCRPEGKLLTEPIGSMLDQGADRCVEVVTEGGRVQGCFAGIVACIAVVLPDVICSQDGRKDDVLVSSPQLRAFLSPSASDSQNVSRSPTVTSQLPLSLV